MYSPSLPSPHPLIFPPFTPPILTSSLLHLLNHSSSSHPHPPTLHPPQLTLIITTTMVELIVPLRDNITRLEGPVTQLAEGIDDRLEFFNITSVNVSSLILNAFSILSDSVSGLAGRVNLILPSSSLSHFFPSSLSSSCNDFSLPLLLSSFLTSISLSLSPSLLHSLHPPSPSHTVILPVGPLFAFIWNLVLLAHMITQVQ